MSDLLRSVVGCLWVLALLAALLHSAVDATQGCVALVCASLTACGVWMEHGFLPGWRQDAPTIIVVFGLAALWFAWVPR